jgi:serine/threonine-protein kinase HipA
MTRAKVYYQGEIAGILEKNNDGFTFQYHESYLNGTGVPISYSLPLRHEKFKNKNLFPFFAGLVAEGWLLEIQSKTQKIAETDYFSLLIKNGKDLIGAVTVIEEQNHEL